MTDTGGVKQYSEGEILNVVEKLKMQLSELQHARTKAFEITQAYLEAERLRARIRAFDVTPCK